MPYDPIIKICGIKTSEMLNVAIEAGADIVGFVHFPKSPRHLGMALKMCTVYNPSGPRAVCR